MLIIYNKETTRLVGGSLSPRLFTSERWAKAFLTRLVNKGNVRSDYAIAEVSTFHKSIEKTETKRNLLSGKEFTQPVNTPLCCDPSSETYWSM